MGFDRNLLLVTFRLILIESHSLRILALRSPEGALLPRESVRAGARRAQALNEAIRRRFGLCTIQLAVLPKSDETSECSVHEILWTQPSARDAITFEAIENFPEGEILENERNAIKGFLTGKDNGFGQFGRLGWIEDFAARMPIHLSRSPDALRQLNQGINFCLLNFKDSSGRSFWFKAVGEPNLREYAFTHELTRLCPAFLPRIVASIPEWSGWITEEVDGRPLSNSLSVNTWKRILGSLYALQEETTRNLAPLSAAGATDSSCEHLRAGLDPFFKEMQRAMHLQTSTTVAPLSDSDLNHLRARADTAITILEDSELPDSLLHRDIGHGNVIVTPTGAVFLDWAEAGIGHPFLSAEHLLANHERLHPVCREERESLRSFYAMLWQHGSDPVRLEVTARVAPAIGALAYAIDTWESKATKSNPEEAWPLLRAILRRTKREFETIRGSLL